MSTLHLHLLVNHLPIVGAILGVPLLALALLRRRDPGALYAAAMVLVVAGITAVIAEQTGEGAEESAERLPGVSETAMEIHEERAEVATPIAVVAALMAIGSVALARWRPGTMATAATVATFVVNLGSAGAMAWTGQSGGWIRHTEVRPATMGGAEGGDLAGPERGERGEGHEGDDDGDND